MNPRHNWNSWDQYQAIHDHHIADYSHFILDDQLFSTLASNQVWWKGVLYCQGGLELHVTKLQQVEYRNGQPWVRTLTYKYHLLHRQNGLDVNVFRYDNIHVHPAHPDAHHRHRYAPDGTEIEPTQHIGVAKWPTLAEVIDEAHEYWLSLTQTTIP